MGNVYRYMECEKCGKIIDVPHDFTFIVKGNRALTKLGKMEDANMVGGKIAAHFCGYCGGYVPLGEDCPCKHFVYQGWNYEDADDPRRWKEPWKDERDRQDGKTLTLHF